MAVGEWDERQLCADGACVGVIGPDGTCKVCGRAAPNWGDERTRGLLTAEAETDDELADDEDEDDDDEDYEDEDDDGEDEDDDDDDDVGEGRVSVASEPAAQSVPGGPGGPGWNERQLCPDGACIGVIGSDGRCKVCGRATAGGAAIGTAIDPAIDGPSSTSAVAAPAAIDPVIAGRPCSDAACTGVSGSDGRCAECGKLVA